MPDNQVLALAAHARVWACCAEDMRRSMHAFSMLRCQVHAALVGNEQRCCALGRACPGTGQLVPKATYATTIAVLHVTVTLMCQIAPALPTGLTSLAVG